MRRASGRAERGFRCVGPWGAAALALLAAAATGCAGQMRGKPSEVTMKTVDQAVARGPFQATWESLEKYAPPAWYLDAKFGIFIHWGVYSVPAFGNEWYPRNMYVEGSSEFKHHVETYGPQAKFGYKDFIPRLTAERFDPDHWAEVFRNAGAKFVVPVAEHHDGFAMYDCGRSEWCAAKMGPKRDIVGDLAKAVRKQGLIFGLSSHRAEHWWFFNGGMTFDSDVKDPKYAALYAPAQSDKTQPDQAFLDDWLLRTCELVDKYEPQLVWFDWWIEQPAFKPCLQKFGAFYYNRGAAWKRGVAINYKNNAFPAKAAVFDVERGQLAQIRPFFWQTDTSISKNSWGYVAKQDYKTAASIVGDLVDIVSKNGALLLNIGPKPDGTIPEPEEAILLEIGRWLRVNGEAIYGTRPWVVFGEGPTQVVAGSFADTKRAAFTGQDLRFTCKGNALYAIALAWPGKELTIRSLAKSAGLAEGNVTGVALLGHDGKLTWSGTDAGLVVQMPDRKPCDHAYALKITGLRVEAFRPDLPIRPGADGSITLGADRAELHGSRIQVEARGGGPAVGFWDDAKEWVSWKVRFAQAGTYEVSARVAAAAGEAEFAIEIGDERLEGKAPKTENWDDLKTVAIGKVRIAKAGECLVKVRPRDAAAWKPLNLASVVLRRGE